MSIEIFPSKLSEEQVIALLEGMQKAGLIDFFKKNDSDDDDIPQETKELLDKMLEEGEREIKEGKGISSEDLLAQIRNEKR